jgi:hypothetical protein
VQVFESTGYQTESHCPMPPSPVLMSEVCAPGKKVVLLGVPGAFTPVSECLSEGFTYLFRVALVVLTFALDLLRKTFTTISRSL